jgi:hypothetical protein
MPIENGQRNDLEGYQQQINQTTDQSLESTQRILRMAADTEEIGIQTASALRAQGEQLNRVEEGLDTIASDLKEAEKALSGMERCCGVITCPGSKPKVAKYDPNAWKDSSNGKVVNGQPLKSINRNGGSVPDGPFVNKITGDAREDEMEENLAEVGNILGNLRNLALDMGNEIDSSSAMISRIEKKAEVVDIKTRSAAARTQKLL